MNKLISEISEMALVSDANDTNGSSASIRDSSPAGRGNPWKGRAGSSMVVKTVPESAPGATLQPQDKKTKSQSNEKLFEADAWPEPSAPFERRVPASNSGSRPVEDKPKNSTSLYIFSAVVSDFSKVS